MADAEALVTPLARAFLREEYAAVDAALPAILEAVKATGAAECWHKHSSFLSHLQGVHRMACLWGLPRDVCLCALLHSAYKGLRYSEFRDHYFRPIFREFRGAAAIFARCLQAPRPPRQLPCAPQL